MKDQIISVLKANNSSVNREILDNGMICICRHDSSAPVVSVQVWVRTGSIHEDRYLGSGISHAIEHMIFKGTEHMSPGDVTRLINNAGGEINAYTSFDRTVFHADMPSDNWVTGLSVIADSLKAPAFTAEEWEKEREVIIREFAMGYDDPNRVLDKHLWRTAFSVHPYRFPIIGLEEAFRRITSADLMTFFRENYVADNMIAVVVGNVSQADAMKELRSNFSTMPASPRKPVLLPQEPRQLAPRMITEGGKWNISRCEMAFHTVELSNPDAVALDIVSEITSNGRSSRFVRKIQEDLQLVHSITSYSYTPLEPGLFGIYAEFDPGREQAVISAINAEIDAIISSGFTSSEIERARRQILTSSLSSLQTMKGQANSYASGEFYTGDPFFTTSYLDRLFAVTKEDLIEVVRKYFISSNCTTAVIAPEGSAAALAEHTVVRAAEPVKLTTPSGINLIVREDHRLPFVYFCVTLKDAFLSETESNCGITRFMTDLLLRGTSRLSSEQIAAEIESRGGSISAFSGVNSFGLRAKCLTADAARFMELIADCLINPAFSEDEMEKQRKIHLAAIQQEKERPIALAQEELRKMMFPAHPYRFSPLGTEKSVSSMSRDMLQEFHSKLLAKSRMVVSVFGDTSAEKAACMVDAGLKSIPAVTDGITGAAAPQYALPLKNVIRAPRQQTIILVGYPGLDLNDPRNDALLLLDTAMSGLSSEIGMKVRENRGLAYFVGTYHQLALQGGPFVIYAGTKEEARDEVEKLMNEEAVRVTAEGLSEEEFNRAKTQVIANSDMTLQNNYDMAMKSAIDELLGIGFDNSFKTRTRFNNLSINSVREAASAVLAQERKATVVVIPESKTN